MKTIKKELYTLVREAVRDELNKIDEVSDEEQKEIDKLYGKETLFGKKLDSKDCVELWITKYSFLTLLN